MSRNDSLKVAAYGPDMAEYLELLGYESPELLAAEPSATSELPSDEGLGGASDASSSLASVCKNAVFGYGNPEAALVFVGEASNAEVERQGQAFEGPAAELLFKMIQAMGYRRDEVYIANVLKCSPSEGSDSSPEEIKTCAPFLNKKLELLAPRVVVTLGAFASQVLLQSDLSLTDLRSRKWEKTIGDRSLVVFPTFHPAFLLENPERKKDVWEDLKRVMDFLKG